MEKLIVINCFNLNKYMFRPFSDGVIPAEILKERISRIPDRHRIVEIFPEGQELTLGFERIQSTDSTLESFWKSVVEIGPVHGEVLLIQGDQPLLDLPMLHKMADLHQKYYAEYTFADAWPVGLSGEIIRGSVLSSLTALAVNRKENPDGASLFSMIQKDINQFDLETLVAPVDFRPWRLDFSLKNLEGWMLADTFRKSGAKNSDDLGSWIQEYEKDLRIIPAYIQIQVSQQCPQHCSYCPYPEIYNPVTDKGKNMTFQEFSSLLEKITAINPEAVISLSPWGEPALNPEIYSMIQAVGTIGSLKLLIETSGIGWDREKLEPLLNSQSIQWIISLDSLDPDLYKTLRGKGQEQALSFIEFLEEKQSEDIYVQIVRMKENEMELERIFPQFQNRKANLIVQKYDFFNGRLPQKKITDLSPVKRFPCWHNKRDLVILVDGRVPLCHEDLSSTMPLGNALKEDLQTIWNRGSSCYHQHLTKDYPEICRNCDEYYTYNF